MKNKHKSLLSVIAIACAVGVPLSLTTAHELPVQAAYSRPTNWDIGYYFNTTSDVWELRSGTSFYSNPSYSRTGTSPNFIYVADFNNTKQPNVIPTNLSIELVSNRDTTGEFFLATGQYYPAEYPLGGTDTLMSFKINNYTNKNYEFYLDLDGSNTTGWSWEIDNELYYDGHYEYEMLLQTSESYNGLIKLPIFAQSTFILYNNARTTIAFNGLYLHELGVSPIYDLDAYDDGYQAGISNNPNLLITAFESLIGMMVNFTFILFTLEMFGVSILSIVGVLFGLITIVWILKTIRG
jgi:hypothetical protein